MRRLAIAFAAMLLAGCAAKPDAAPTTSPAIAPRGAVLATLTGLPTPLFDASAAVGEWESFLTTYPKRDYGSLQNAAAAEFLRSQLEGAGFDAQTLMFPFNPAVGPVVEVRVVRGTLVGDDATHRLALIAHYDNQQATTQAAYDDGAGTINVLNLCRTLAQAKAVLHRTIDCLFFDAEEEGLIGSTAYTQWYDATPDRGFVYDIAFGYDMTGINWPGHAWKLYAFLGDLKAHKSELTEPHTAFLGLVFHEFFGTVIAGAREGIEIVPDNPRSSDEASFQDIGVPVVRFAGGLKATDYPAYHTPLDTTAFVYQFVGGRPNYEKGVDAVVRSSYYAVLAFDAYDAAAVPAV